MHVFSLLRFLGCLLFRIRAFVHPEIPVGGVCSCSCCPPNAWLTATRPHGPHVPASMKRCGAGSHVLCSTARPVPWERSPDAHVKHDVGRGREKPAGMLPDGPQTLP